MSALYNSLDFTLSVEAKISFKREMFSEIHSALRKDLALGLVHKVSLFILYLR